MGKRDSDDEQSIRQIISEQDIKLLFVTQKQHALQPTLRFLNKRNWKYAIVASMKEAFDVVGKEKPTHVLMSFDLPINHKKMEHLLKNTFGVIAIVYSETFESTTYSQMRKTTCENIILSPISGPTVQMKVRNTAQILEQNQIAVVKQKKQKKEQNLEEVIEEGPEKKCTINDLPGGGYWQSLPDKVPPTWKLSTFLECKLGDEVGTFYFSGKQPPNFNEKGVWESTDESGRIFFAPKLNRSQKSKKKNWWDNPERVTEFIPKDRKYRYEPTPEDSAAEEGNDGLNKRFFRVKGKASDSEMNGRFDSSLVGAQAKIIIRQTQDRKRLPLIMNVEEEDVAAFKPYDEEGAPHPFFETDQPDIIQKAPEQVSDEEESLFRSEFDDGSTITSQGTRDKTGITFTKGEKRKRRGFESGEAEEDDIDSEFLKGQGLDTENDFLDNYNKKKERLNILHGEKKEKGKSEGEGAEAEDTDSIFAKGGAQDKNSPLSGIGQSPYKREKKVPNWSVLDKSRKTQGVGVEEEDPLNARGTSIANEKDIATGGGNDLGAVEPKSKKESEIGANDPVTGVPIGSIRNILGRKINSILAVATAKTLEEMSSESTETAFNKIRNTERVGVIPIRTLGAQGILIVALGDNKELSKSMLAQVTEKLAHHLVMKGQAPVEAEYLNVQIDHVDFVNWGVAEMEFITLDRMGPDEIGVAFLPGDDIIPAVANSAREYMVGVELNCIKPEIAVLFDVYIWMKDNRKYIRYVKEGQRIDQGQIDKLVRFKTDYFHIRREDLDKFKSYCAANYINVKIRDSKIRKAS